MKEYTNEEIKEFIRQNPVYLNGHYQMGADKFGVGRSRFEHQARALRRMGYTIDNLSDRGDSQVSPFGPMSIKEMIKQKDSKTLEEAIEELKVNWKKVEGQSVKSTSKFTPGGPNLEPGAIKEFIKDTWDQHEVTRHVSGGVKRLMVASDLHGVFYCERTFNCFLEVLRNNPVDEVVLNGDILDFPLLSKHTSKLINVGPMKDYSEIREIELVKEKILKPLREATDANIVYRTGNHEVRLTEPFNLGQSQLAKLAVIYNHYGTVKLEEMLDCKGIGIEYDGTPVRSYYNIFDILHGLSLTKSASEQNIMSRMGSGTSGHTHRAGAKYITKADKEYCWIESGCMRLKRGVEYLPVAVTADWQTAFVEVNFDLSQDKPMFFANCHAIINGVTSFHGTVYRGQ